MKTGIRRSFLLLYFTWSSLSIIAQGWTQLDDFPSTPRDDGTSFTINSITYCGTGLNSTWNPTNDFYAFDMNAENWSQISGLPINQARQYSNGFASATHGYLFGGLNTSGYLNDLWTYDPQTDTWTEASSMPSVGRSGASCFVIGDTAYILGGQTDTEQAISEVWAYSISADSWIQKNPLPDSLWRASSISYQGNGYLLFGRDQNDMYKNDFYKYSPSTDSWTVISSFPSVGRTYAGIGILNDKIVSIAGRDSIGNSYNDMWEYSISSDSWSLAINLPSDQRRGGICFHSNNGLYYTTGINLNDVRLTETWKFDLFLSNDDKALIDLVVFPIPTKDYVKIIHSIPDEIFEYQINSIQGKTVLSGKAKSHQEINTDQLKSGNYLINIKTEFNTVTKKIMIY